MDDTQDHVARDQWISTVSAHRALLLFLAVVAAAVGLCAFAALRKKRLNQVLVDVEAPGTSVSAKAWEAIKKMIMSTCWSDRRSDDSNKLAEEEAEDIELQGKELEKLQLAAAADKGSCIAAAAATVVSPVWQRRILMGERCELPHFSGLILYNEQGLLIHHNRTSNNDNLPSQQQEKPAVVLTTLRDLL